MAAPVLPINLSVVGCQATLGTATEKVVHAAHVYHREIQPSINLDAKQQIYLWCPGWAG